MLRRLVGALVCAVFCALAAGCVGSADPNGPAGSGLQNSSHPSSAAGPQVRRRAEQRLLDQRAEAVRQHDLARFLRTLDRSNARFVARERTYFANLEQLPLARFGYRVSTRSWPKLLGSPSWGRDVHVPRVQVLTQLAGFDAAPVRRVTGFAFRRVQGRLVIVSDRTGAGSPYPGSQPAPWDLTRVHVRDRGNVLGIFDDRAWPRSLAVMSAVHAGIYDVARAVPYAWPDRAVVYGFYDHAVLASFDAVPGGNIDHLGALTFPVYAVPGGPGVVSRRFTLLPASLRAGEPFLGQIVRHELTHIAVGVHDDGLPVWLAEGVAEYVGARPLSTSERRIATLAVSRAASGAGSMPASKTYNHDHQQWHYALSWMAVDYIAATRGEATVWRLVAALHAHGRGTSDANQDPVLLQVLGYDSHQLARRAAARILHIYG